MTDEKNLYLIYNCENFSSPYIYMFTRSFISVRIYIGLCDLQLGVHRVRIGVHEDKNYKVANG